LPNSPPPPLRLRASDSLQLLTKFYMQSYDARRHKSNHNEIENSWVVDGFGGDELVRSSVQGVDMSLAGWGGAWRGLPRREDTLVSRPDAVASERVVAGLGLHGQD
jgi:hypothetical protein